LRRVGAFAAAALLATTGFFAGRSTAPDNASKICDATGNNVKAELVTAIQKGGVTAQQEVAIEAYGGSDHTLKNANIIFAQGGAQGLINALQGRCAFR
ncbi:MAG: hypothetical protein ACK48E_04295, partial [Holosporales bacterium]